MDVKLQYIDRLVSCIKTGERAFLAIRMLKALLQATFERKVGNKHPEIDNLSDMVNHLETKYNLFDSVFADLQSYCSKVREEMAKPERQEELKSDPHNKAIHDTFAHASQINERLLFFSFYAKCSSKVRISGTQLEIIWSELVVKSPIDHDRKAAYEWLRSLIDNFVKSESQEEKDKAASLATYDDLMQFFRKSIIDVDGKSMENSEFMSDLAIEGFHLIQSFFIMLNTVTGKLQRLTDEDAAYKGKHLEETSAITGAEVPASTAAVTDSAGNKP